MSDPLGGLITAYDTALRKHHELPVHNPEQLIGDLQCAAQLRNVLCHGSWQAPDGEGGNLNQRDGWHSFSGKGRTCWESNIAPTSPVGAGALSSVKYAEDLEAITVCAIRHQTHTEDQSK
ncbi:MULTISPECIES: hypothetical protein [unclassified Pseudomonas]|uniref:hypothetical protein n=1 Tax=unclassified Pseudomonas TaxID=196821 RepID=UPI00147DE4EA|nr:MULTISPECIES: hypothetical protein [unclassified Pseudomonas]